jgi:hypothetical protein
VQCPSQYISVEGVGPNSTVAAAAIPLRKFCEKFVWAYEISHCRDQSARLEAGFACLGVLLCLPEMFVPQQRADVFQ